MNLPLSDAGLLTLAHWLSPAFPTGAFAFSHGIEAAIRDRRFGDAAGLQDWLAVMLTHGAGRSDAIFLHLAHAGPPDLPALAALAAALQPSAARRAETQMQGAAFAAALRAVWGQDVPDMALPLVVGRAAALQGLPAGPVAALYLQAMVVNLTQAAQRLMPLGQTAAARIVAALGPLAANVAAETTGLTTDDLGSAAFAIDIASMRHEVMEPRLFRS